MMEILESRRTRRTVRTEGGTRESIFGRDSSNQIVFGNVGEKASRIFTGISRFDQIDVRSGLQWATIHCLIRHLDSRLSFYHDEIHDHAETPIH